MFAAFVIFEYEFLNCPQYEKMDFKITVTAGNGSKMQKMLENQGLEDLCIYSLTQDK